MKAVSIGLLIFFNFSPVIACEAVLELISSTSAHKNRKLFKNAFKTKSKKLVFGYEDNSFSNASTSSLAQLAEGMGLKNFTSQQLESAAESFWKARPAFIVNNSINSVPELMQALRNHPERLSFFIKLAEQTKQTPGMFTATHHQERLGESLAGNDRRPNRQIVFQTNVVAPALPNNGYSLREGRTVYRTNGCTVVVRGLPNGQSLEVSGTDAVPPQYLQAEQEAIRENLKILASRPKNEKLPFAATFSPSVYIGCFSKLIRDADPKIQREAEKHLLNIMKDPYKSTELSAMAYHEGFNHAETIEARYKAVEMDKKFIVSCLGTTAKQTPDEKVHDAMKLMSIANRLRSDRLYETDLGWSSHEPLIRHMVHKAGKEHKGIKDRVFEREASIMHDLLVEQVKDTKTDYRDRWASLAKKYEKPLETKEFKALHEKCLNSPEGAAVTEFLTEIENQKRLEADTGKSRKEIVALARQAEINPELLTKTHSDELVKQNVRDCIALLESQKNSADPVLEGKLLESVLQDNQSGKSKQAQKSIQILQSLQKKPFIVAFCEALDGIMMLPQEILSDEERANAVKGVGAALAEEVTTAAQILADGVQSFERQKHFPLRFAQALVVAI